MAAPIDRRRFLGQGLWAAAGAGALAVGGPSLLTGCGGNASSGAGGGSARGSGTPVRGGNLVIATEADISPSFDPSAGHFDSTGVMYARTVFDPLAAITPDGKVKPYLAESITPNADYTEWTITVRDGVVFHDGTPLTAGVVKENFDYYKAALLVGPAIPLIEHTDVMGPLTVRITMASPWVPFDFWLAGFIGGQIAYMISPKMMGKGTGGWGPNHPSGTGPFVFKDWEPNDHFSATANPHYWRKGLPYLESVTFRPTPDEVARFDALQSGDIDLMHTDVGSLILQARHKGFSVVDDSGKAVGEPDMDMVLLNLTQTPLDNIYARQALAYATDRSRYIRVIGDNVEMPTDGPFVAGTPYYNGPTGYPSYDLAKARNAVAQYRRSTGTDLPTFTLGTTPSPSTNKWAELMQSMWKDAGITVSLDTQVQQTSLISNALNGKFQAYLWRQFANVHPDLNYIFWSSTTDFGALGVSIDMTRNHDPLIDTALDDARKQTDPAAQAAYYQSVAQRFAIDLPYIWCSRVVWAIAARGSVQNFDNPTLPDHGGPAFGMLSGIISATEIWKTS